MLRSKLPATLGLYLEPFVGGGAAYFSLEPPRAVLNDVHRELVDLYRMVAADDGALREALGLVSRVWDEELTAAAGAGLGPLCTWYRRRGRQGDPAPQELLEAAAARVAHAPARPRIVASLADKLRRMRRLEEKHQVSFDPELVRSQVETGLRAGYYSFLRDRTTPGDRAEQVAAFYFVRELCYGSMFRQNKEGRFNIPYGGMGYNKKRLGPKVAALLSPARRALLAGAEIANLDFRELFAGLEARLGPADLVFLDPPYDSDFREYDGRAFGEAEQRALAEVVAKLPCRVVGIMKATPLVLELYRRAAADRARAGRRLQLEEYGKTYAYNVRGRNQRQVRHLLLWDTD